MLAWAMCSFVGSQINVALTVHQTKAVPPELLGRVLKTNRSLSLGATVLGSVFAGFTILTLGPRQAGQTVTLGTLIIALLLAAFFTLTVGTTRSAFSQLAVLPSRMRDRWRTSQHDAGFIILALLWRGSSRSSRPTSARNTPASSSPSLEPEFPTTAAAPNAFAQRGSLP